MRKVPDTLTTLCDNLSLHRDLTAAIAIGVASDGDRGDIEWAVLNVEAGRCLRVATIPPDGDDLSDVYPELELIGSVPTWVGLVDPTPPVLADAVNRGSLTIQGDLPTFIRFAQSFVVLVGHVARAFQQSVTDDAPVV